MSSRATLGLWWPLGTARYPVYIEYETLDGRLYAGCGQSERFRWPLFDRDRHPIPTRFVAAICRVLGGAPS